MDLKLKNRQDLKARALLLGDRLDLKLFKIADCLATTPLTLEVDAEGGIAVLFRYGVVVFFGVQSLDEVRFVESLKPLLTNPYADTGNRGTGNPQPAGAASACRAARCRWMRSRWRNCRSSPMP